MPPCVDATARHRIRRLGEWRILWLLAIGTFKPSFSPMRISLFIPCYVDQFFPEVGIAMVRVLERLGHEVDVPAAQTCCGQPAFNAGFEQEAAAVAEHWIRCFRDADLIAAPSASCVAMVRSSFGRILPHREEIPGLAARTLEFSELLVDHLDVTSTGARFPHRVTFHDGCHGLRELGIGSQPRMLLRNVEGLELCEHDEVESCCGFGGSFSVKFADISTAMAEVKAESIQRVNVRYVVSCDSSCLMQLRGYFEKHSINVKCIHLAEVLASR